MKTCSECKQQKPTSEYRKNSKSPDGLQYACKDCARARDKRDYQRPGRKEQITSRRDKEYVRQRFFVWNWLASHPCVDCGEDDIVVLQFDHVRGVKAAHVSRMIGKVSDATLIDEIDKCEVRCANCHTRRTAKQFGWLKPSLTS